MDGLVSVCHFCEQHGPSVVFCTQAHQQLPSVEQLQLARECSSVNSDECAACRAFSMEKGCLVTESSSVCYVSSRVPLSAGVASLLHRACVRSLSCEVCPGGEGCVYFGDDVRGHALSYIFSLRDLQARGLKRWFSVVVLVKERAYLLSAWTFLVHHLQQVVQQLQERALQVFNKEGGSLRRVQTELPHRQKASVRGLSELVDSPLIWTRLHTANVWLMAAAGARLVEVMAPACDPFTPAGPAPDTGGHLARDATDSADPVDFAVDVARHADDSEVKIAREIDRGNAGGREFCSLNKDGEVRDGAGLVAADPVDIAVDVARHADDSELKIAREVNGGNDGEFYSLNKDGEVEKDVFSRTEKPDGGDRIDHRNRGIERRVGIEGSSQEKVIADTKLVSNNVPRECSSGVKVDSSCEIAVTSENENSLSPSGTSLKSERFSQNLKSVSVDPKINFPQVDDPGSRRLQSTDKSLHDQMSGNNVDISSLSAIEVLTLRDLREVLGGDQFGISLQHLLLGFPLMIRCAQDASVAPAAPAACMLRAFRRVLPRFLHSLVSVTTEKTTCSEQLKNDNHSDQCKNTINDNLNNTLPDNERKFVKKSSQFAKIYEGTSSTFVPTSMNYYRLPSSPSIEAYDALEIDTLVLVVTAPQALSPGNVNESNISICRNVSYASLPKDSSGIQIPNFKSKTFDTSDFSCPTDRTPADLNEPASKSRQFIKRCKFRLEDVWGRPYQAASASEALPRAWCALVRSLASACTNPALSDGALHLTVHHALLSWCSKAKLWDSLLAQQRTRLANAGPSKSTAISAATDSPASPKPKNSFGFSLSPPQWPKFLSSSRPKKQSDSSSQRRDKHCDRYEAVGLYPSLYESSALGDDISSVDAQKVNERHNLNSNAPVSVSSEDARSQSSSKSNTNVVIGFQPSHLDRAPENSHSSGYNNSATESPRKPSTVTSSPSRLTAQSNSLSALKPDISKAKLDSQGKLVNKLYPSISEEDVLMPSSYNALESETHVMNPDLFVRSVPSQSSLTSTVGPNMYTPETLDPSSLTSLASLSAAVGLPESQLQKILLAVGASEVDVPLLQCWAFHLRCNSSSSGFR